MVLRPKSSLSLVFAGLIGFVLTVPALLWWWPLVFGGRLPDFMDTVTQLWPWRIAVARQLSEGTLPWWLPNQAGGYPLAANPQVSLWYPPQWPFFLWPTATLYGWVLVGHILWGGFGVYWAARRFGAHTWSALTAALAFQFGAVMVSRMALTPHLYAVAWIPWMLGLTELACLQLRAWRHRGIPWSVSIFSSQVGLGLWAFLALFAALQFLGGSPQVSYGTAFALGAFAVVRCYQIARWRGLVGLAFGGLLAASLAALLGAVQLLPTLEFLRNSARHPIPVEKLTEQALNGDMLLRALIGYTAPVIEDTDSIHAIGLGLLLSIPSLLWLRPLYRRRALALIAAFAVMLVLSWGRFVPLLSETLPLYQSFHAPRRSLLAWAAFGPVLAALGMTGFLGVLQRGGWSVSVRIAFLALILTPNVYMLPRLERAFADPQRFEVPDHRRQILQSDPGRRYLTMDPTFRYAHGSRIGHYGTTLLPNSAALANLVDVQVYDPLVSQRLADFRRLLNRQSGDFYPSHGVLFSNPGHPALRLLAVQYIVGRWDVYDPSRLIPGARWDREQLASILEPKPIVNHGMWPVWQIAEPRPFAWIPQRVTPAPNASEALRIGINLDPYQHLLQEDGLSWQLPAGQQATSVGITLVSAREVQLAIPGNSQSVPRVVAVAMVYQSGWQARGHTSGGPSQSLMVAPLSGLIIGVVVPPGVEQVILLYRPAALRNGMLLTILGLVVLTAILWRNGIRLRPVSQRSA